MRLAPTTRAAKSSAALAVAAASLLLSVEPGVAATSNVSCSVTALVASITSSNAMPGADTLNLAPGCSYALVAPDNGLNGLPVVTDALILNGRGASISRRAGAPGFRILSVAESGSLSISGITISGGLALDCPGDPFGALAACGGGIESLGTLTVSDSRFTSNSATSALDGGFEVEGGAIETFGTATVHRSAFTGNSTSYTGTFPFSVASGGAISNENQLSVDQSTFSGNSVSATGDASNGGVASGSAIVNFGDATLAQSILRDNVSTTVDSGLSIGAVRNVGGTITVSSTVITHNTANAPAGEARGGGIESIGRIANLTMTGSTVLANVATAQSSGVPPGCGTLNLGASARGGGISISRGTASISSTLVSGNLARSFGGCAFASGGGIVDTGATVDLSRVIVSGNTAHGDTARGGGIRNEASGVAGSVDQLTITRSVVSGNGASGTAASGGGISSDAANTVLLSFTSVFANRPGNCDPPLGTCTS